MRDNDQQLGKPMRVYRDTKANIEALGLGAADEGCEAYATNTDEFGTFDGAAWVWGTLHAQAHTLASHSTKAHTELTGVAANQHHAQDHKARHQEGGADDIGTVVLSLDHLKRGMEIRNAAEFVTIQAALNDL